MKLESQVASLELSKRLKELGVNQESLFSYFKFALDENPRILENVYEHHGNDMTVAVLSGELEYKVSAFTVAELGEMLPETIEVTDNGYTDDCFLHIRKSGEKWTVCYSWYEQIKLDFECDTEADARAKMLIYLLENKLITL